MAPFKGTGSAFCVEPCRVGICQSKALTSTHNFTPSSAMHQIEGMQGAEATVQAVSMQCMVMRAYNDTVSDHSAHAR